MSSSTKILDPAFQGAGQRVGLELWRIENFQPVPLLKSDYGKFYSGDSYIILQTISKGGAYSYDIHFWIGKDSSQDEAGTAAIKAVELDAVLGGRAVQHREPQGHESDKFLSYFKPCIIPLEGGFASGFRKPEEEKFQTRLYICRGKRVVRMKQVPFARSSLNHDDVFILDMEKKIYQFNGANSNIQERAKALEVVQHLKEQYHDGKCDVAIIEDGKLQSDSDSGEFWVLFGGFAPIAKKHSTEDDFALEIVPAKLYSINDGQLKLEDNNPSRAILENNECYLLDCGAEIFIWVGRVTQVDERKAASKAAEELIINQNRSKATRITQVIQGYETHSFKSHFESWPAGSGSGAGTPDGEEARGKVAALLKQQGVDVKGTSKGPVLGEEIPPLIEGAEKLEVWLINGGAKNQIPKEEIGKFYSADCYIVLCTYRAGEKKDEYYLCCWIGKDSDQDDRATATRLSNSICSSLKGRPVQGFVFQGKEPPQFIALFQPMVVLKGGISSGYKKLLTEKNINDETYTSDSIALIQVSGTSAHNSKSIQVDAVATSLTSSECFLLQSGNSLFAWHGNSSTLEQQQWAARVAEFIKPGVILKHTKEGTESSAFWFSLGGKHDYTSKIVVQDIVKDPHLYTISSNKGKFEFTEVFNFSQDDLLTEDMLILDTHVEIFVWVGQHVDSKEKQKAFIVGQKYIEHGVSDEGPSPDVPMYIVTEGNEPCFFTTYFIWNNTKAMVQGNSFQKKLSLLFGTAMHAPQPNKPDNVSHSGPTQRASALAALSSAFNASSSSSSQVSKANVVNHSGGPTQRASALAALSSAFNSSPNDSLQSNNKVYTVNQSGPTQRASALVALSTAFNPSSSTKNSAPKRPEPRKRSQRAAAIAALSSVLTAESTKGENEISTARSSGSSSPGPEAAGTVPTRTQSFESGLEDLVEISTEKEDNADDQTYGSHVVDSEEKRDQDIVEYDGESTYSYERLKSNSSYPVRGIDYKRREVYLSESEFQTVFGLTRELFYQQPKWKQDAQKRKKDLF
ncbi:villin-2-like isoform X1 [Zingiber officinale]|uniref:villin-2-like isoform X1 n=2 Tax=Zingiber officinale TaxID=94328 RepID=UPI001C4C98B7|nr:villin-2-like isoform X1 [Zingiber officinale]XP_042412348.1 villin-2-like isoform X1 [Zingiber officinale]